MNLNKKYDDTLKEIDALKNTLTSIGPQLDAVSKVCLYSMRSRAFYRYYMCIHVRRLSH